MLHQPPPPRQELQLELQPELEGVRVAAQELVLALEPSLPMLTWP